MNIFKTVGHLIWGDVSNQELFQIPSGQFYVYKPTSFPGKKTKECIFIDSMVTVRRTSVEFQFTLAVSRLYEEGEDENDDAEDDNERFFPINENMQFRKYVSNGATTFSWQGQEDSETADFTYEYVCDEETSSLTCNSFETLMYQCMYEAKYLQSHIRASDADIAQFEIHTPINSKPAGKITSSALKSPKSQKPSSPKSNKSSSPKLKPESPKRTTESTSRPPEVADQPVKYEGVAEAEGELHLYNATTNLFEVQAFQVVVQLHHLSFIWNYFDDKGQVYSWLIRFKDEKPLRLFKAHFAECMYEVINRRSWGVAEESDQVFYMKTYDPDVKMNSPKDEFEESDESEREKSDDEEDDEEEEEEEEDHRVSFGAGNDKSKNSHLQVGYKDRSFVLRGNKIGIFKHGDGDNLEFDSTISRVANKAGREINPSLMLLHDQDTSMMLLDPKDQNTAYRMDLEYGKVVEEWSLPTASGVTHIMGDSKYSHLYGTNTMVGMSKDSVFRIDPRVSGNKIVQDQSKQYAKTNQFTAAATTANGSLVIGGHKGEMKLFNTIGKVAKTALPGIGNPILGIDVTGDGEYVLATCKTYLLLINVKNPANKTLGFDKSFPADSKPTPIRLQLQPQDVALMKHEISFTPAKFNMGENELEKTIVTSTGPYVITWNFRRIKMGHINEYQIKRYEDKVVADNFKYGHDRSIIVTLQDDGMLLVNDIGFLNTLWSRI
ncbi:hypothetical protein DFQ26_001597 [Actinomortierella ambigua]|nr:hypothetical protein DFQ26_001597 [Actinomortierella ambigua]